MGETAGFGAMKGQVGRAQLPDPPKALKRRGIDQSNGERFGWLLPIEADGPMIGARSHQSVCSSCCCS